MAKLHAGPLPLSPAVTLFADEQLSGELRAHVQLRLERFVSARIALRLQPLLAIATGIDIKAGATDALPAQARGIAHQLLENFGSLDFAQVTLPQSIGSLARALSGFGVWFGRRSIYLPKMLRPDAAGLIAMLWGVWTKQKRLYAPPPPGLTSFVNDANVPAAFLAAAGFRVVGRRAIRLDMLERLEEELEKAASNGVHAEIVLPKLVSLLGSSNEELKAVLTKLGWHVIGVADNGAGTSQVWRKRQSARPRQLLPKQKTRLPQIAVRPDSPFASLATLIRK